MTLESRPRTGSLLNKVTKLRSRSSSSASPISKTDSVIIDRSAIDMEQSAILTKFEFFTALPLEIQAHILSFIPSRILHKTISRTCRYYREFTESHTRRRILDLMSPYSWDIRSTQDNYKRIAQSRPVNVLVFEAQRPIDTITTKHTLHFSHFTSTTSTTTGFANDGSRYGSSTLVHFAFTPVDEPSTRDQSADSNASSGYMTSSTDTTSSLPFPARIAGSNQDPMIHADDQVRLNPRSVTSSVAIPRRSGGTSSTPIESGVNTPRAGSIRRRQFTDVASPTEWRESSNRVTARLVPEGEDSVSVSVQSAVMEASTRYNAANLQGRAYEGFNASSPQISGHWSEPIASSSAAYEGDRYESSDDGRSPQRKSRRCRQKQRPTYAFELDPLDSFESWILSLKLQRRSHTSSLLKSDNPFSSARPMRWELPVSEGLDRIFREWFHPQVPPESRSLNSTLQRATLIASLNSTLSYTSNASSVDFNQTESIRLPRQGKEDIKMMEEDDDEEVQPESRVLEFDGPSCILNIQPHAVPFESHPALTSMYSHHYLSHASLSSSLTSRVEFTFHCESVIINAARLLNALEDVDEDVQRASDLARQRGAQVVAGSSGSTSWSYSSGMNNDTFSNTSRWGNAPTQGSVAVVVFAQARD